MGTPVTAQHFFTVRGRGFDDVQWGNVTEATRQIVERAKTADIKVTFEGDATHLKVSGQGGTPLVIWRTGEPGVPKEVTTEGPFDAVVQTVLATVKNIAPSIFEMTCPDGRDYRRVLAREDSTWDRVKKQIGTPKQTKRQVFLEAMSKRKWPNPNWDSRDKKSKKEVKFLSLPEEDKKRHRAQWEIQYGRQYDEAQEKAKKEVDEAQRAVKKLKDTKDTATNPGSRKKAMQNFDHTIYHAAIRVASKTKDLDLKRALLTILRQASPSKPTSPAQVRDEVCQFLRGNGHEVLAKKWETHSGDFNSKTAAVFPLLRQAAWESVLDFTRQHPTSKTAAGSTAVRTVAANRLAGSWLRGAVLRAGRTSLQRLAGLSEEKFNKLASSVKQAGNKPLFATLLFVRQLEIKS